MRRVRVRRPHNNLPFLAPGGPLLCCVCTSFGANPAIAAIADDRLHKLGNGQLARKISFPSVDRPTDWGEGGREGGRRGGVIPSAEGCTPWGGRFVSQLFDTQQLEVILTNWLAS